MLLRSAIPVLALTLAAAGCNSSPFNTHPEGYREFAYVANASGNSVTVLDLVYLRPDRTLSVGVAPVALAINPKLEEAYVVNSQPDQANGSLSVIDTARNVVVATIPVHRNPVAIAVNDTGRRAYVANTGSNSVSVVDLVTRRQIATFPTGDHPDTAVLAPDGRTLIVTNRGSGSVSLFAVAVPSLDPAVRPQPPLSLRATFPHCPGATSPVILPNSTRAFIACSGGRQVMALALAVPADSWYGTQDPSLTSDHELAMLDVGLHPTHLTMKPDGGEVFASNSDSDSISEIATQNADVGSTYAIGNRPAHGVVSADGGALWVSNSGAQSVSLYSIEDGKFLSSLRTGLNPDALAFSADEHLLLAADTKSGDVAVIRITSKLGPSLLTILPAGGNPSAIAIKATDAKQ